MTLNPSLFASDTPAIPVRAVHLDLKGFPPTPDRLVALMRVFAAARYNAVLVEWEDMFPWTVDARFRCKTAYAPDDVGRIHQTAADLGLQVIPLVQCLGHAETPLGVSGYERLREVPWHRDMFNPLAPGAREMVDRMVDDVLALTPGVKYFHLGGDEARSFGTHPDTSAYVARHGKGALYLHHIEPILDKLNGRGIRPILWHDMMSDWEPGALLRLGGKADLMVWGYGDHPDNGASKYHTGIIKRFKEHGLTLWGATIFKGGGVLDGDLPDPRDCQANAMGWVDVAQRFGFVGVAATGWSRNGTCCVQKHPLDACLDSLLNVGVVLHDGCPPPSGMEACLQELDRLGERTRFAHCRGVLSTLSAARGTGWHIVRLLRGQLALEAACPARRGGSHAITQLRRLLDEIKKTESAGAEMGQAFAGLVDPVWIEEYLTERIEPLRTEFREMESHVRRNDPEAYAAAFAGEARDVGGDPG